MEYPPLKILIVDDEAKARDLLRLLIETHISHILKIQCADSADQATELLSHFTPDLVFLDIRMPNKDAFVWLQELKERNFGLIFTTAFDQYAIRAIRFSAFDYLLKPIDIEDLQASVDRFRKSQKATEESFSNLFFNTAQKKTEDFRLQISTTEGIYYIQPNEIIWCKADGNYTFIYCKDEQRILSSRPIGVFEDLLEDFGIIRCHKSYLVNIQYVKKYSEFGLTLEGNITLEIARRRRKDVKEKLDLIILP